MDVEVFNFNPCCTLTHEKILHIVDEICFKTNLSLISCSIIFVNDRDLAEMHDKYLNDPSPTDVMTFSLGDDEIEGEIYISCERARAHSLEYNVSYDNEIIRLIVHGLLHLAGYDDLSESEYQKMKEQEDYFVEYFSN